MSTSATTLPRARATRSTPLRGDNAWLVQAGLFVLGAVLLPLGLIVIGLGWYGIAHTPYEYNQLVYLVSGGFLGLGITFAGGFLYFSAWIARTAADQKAATDRLADSLLALADAIPSVAPAPLYRGAQLVVAGTADTVHRSDCGLIAGRTDLQPAGSGGPGLTACRVCQPYAG